MSPEYPLPTDGANFAERNYASRLRSLFELRRSHNCFLNVRGNLLTIGYNQIQSNILTLINYNRG